MALYTATLVGAIKDPAGTNSNIVLTVTFSNGSGEIQTRTFVGSNFTVADVKTWAATVITTLNQRDTALALANSAIQAGGNAVILATG